MNRAIRHGLVLACIPLLLLAWGGTAHALLIGNPAPDFAQGDFGAGAAFSDDRLTLFLDFGITDDGTLQGQVSDLDFDGGAEGTELGIGYRHKLPGTIDLGDVPLRLGILGSYRFAEIESGVGVDFDYSLIQVGVGGSITPVEKLNAFAAAIYERFETEVVVRNPFFPGQTTRRTVTDTNVGLSVGAEYWIAESFVAGLEIHPGLEDDDITIFGEFKF